MLKIVSTGLAFGGFMAYIWSVNEVADYSYENYPHLLDTTSDWPYAVGIMLGLHRGVPGKKVETKTLQPAQ